MEKREDNNSRPAGTKYVPPHMRQGDRSPTGSRLENAFGMGRSGFRSERNGERNSERIGDRGGDHIGDRCSDRGRGRGSRQNRLQESETGTGWDVRDGRRRMRECEQDVFGDVVEHTTGINFDSYDNIPVDVTGNDATTIIPVESFQSVKGVHSSLMANVDRVRYTKPTPIQKHAIPVIMGGRDLMACAQTGSGKTAAFLFPIMVQMLQLGPPEPFVDTSRSAAAARHCAPFPVSLVLAPTRELAVQIYNEARKFQFLTGVRTVALYGGCDVRAQCQELDRGCDICVATPGRLNDMLDRKKVRVNQVQFLVLDEADRMLDMGFAPQIRDIIDRSDMPTSAQGRLTVMFSATFPREIQQLAREFLAKYIHLAVGRVGSTNDFIKQRLVYADEDQKPRQLILLLREQEKGLTIIFVETKRKADMVEDYLLDEKYPAVSIHGDRTQQEREEALRLFKSGRRPILVATDVAARGLDITNVVHVINCDLPSNIDDYVHRIGRTGRAGNHGLATSFVNEQCRPILRDLLGILEECNQEIPPWFHALVQTHSHTRGNTFGRNARGRGSGGGKFRDSRTSESGGGYPKISKDIRGGHDTVTYSHLNAESGGTWRSQKPPPKSSHPQQDSWPQTANEDSW